MTITELQTSGFVHPKNDSVRIEDIDQRLVAFLSIAAPIHKALFSMPIVITSGRDNHTGGAHMDNRAVDLRSYDKDKGGQAVFGAILAYIALSVGTILVQDERAKPGAPHWHIRALFPYQPPI